MDYREQLSVLVQERGLSVGDEGIFGLVARFVLLNADHTRDDFNRMQNLWFSHALLCTKIIQDNRGLFESGTKKSSQDVDIFAYILYRDLTNQPMNVQ